MDTKTPNIVLIITDQQSRHMMSCAGNRYLKTPAMDRLAAEGVRFSRAYCTNPVCVPSRFSLMTGRMPSEIGMWSNADGSLPPIPEKIKQSGLGAVLKAGGYDAVYAGKQHLPKMDATDLGFDVLTLDQRDELARCTAEFVGRPHDKPYCLVASFINPHDICYMAIREHAEGATQRGIMKRATVEIDELDAALALADQYDRETFFSEHCPPLPPNVEPQEDEPEAIDGLMRQRRFRGYARDAWSDDQWRMHRWVYARLTERVDGQIGILMDALRESPEWENTVVIFTSDHGDHDASHRLEHKTAPYEEAAGIPLIIRQPGGAQGVVNEQTLVSNGLDLLPTLCDYAGIEPPSDLKGVSLRPCVEGSEWESPREMINIECEIARTLCSLNHKYVRCFEGGSAEQLYDRESDPFETRNALHDEQLQSVVNGFRERFDDYFDSTVIHRPGLLE